MPDPTTPAPSVSGGLASRSFQGLLGTQWLGSINDNVFRWFVIGVGKDQITPDQASLILALGSACFILPYVLFAPLAGWLADRFAKRWVIVSCKVAEIVIMCWGAMAVAQLPPPVPGQPLHPWFWALLAGVFLMGTQSALFAPAKLGTIPELLTEKTIAAGNGIFNLATLSATIIGMAIGGWLSDITLRGQQDLWLVWLVLVGLATGGTLLSLLVQSLPAADARAPFPWNAPAALVRDVARLASHRQLLAVAGGIIFFWTVAAFAQLNIDTLAEEGGGLLESDRTPLLVSVTLGIGLGSLLAGCLSIGRIELGLVPLGAGMMVVGFLMLGGIPEVFIGDHWYASAHLQVCALLVGLGVGAGLFDVPLASYLQHHSPIRSRGSILAATNGLAFSGILVMFGIWFFIRMPAGPPDPARISQSYTLESVPAEQQDAVASRVASAVDDLLKAPIGEQPGLAQHVAQLPAAAQRVGLTQLLWADCQRRAEANQVLGFDPYWSEFRDPAIEAELPGLASSGNTERAIGRQVRQVILAAGNQPGMLAKTVFWWTGWGTLIIALLAAYRLRKPMVRLLFEFLFRAVYKVRIRGLDRFPQTGPAVVVANHSSWLDGAILLVLVPRIPHTIAWAGNFSGFLLERFAKFCGVVLMGSGPKSIRRGLQDSRQVLQNGEVLGIFPEGGISRECQVKTFKPGLAMILKKIDSVPIVPVYFDELWGSNFSYVGGRCFRRWPWPLHRPLSVHIGQPISSTQSLFEIRQAVQELSTETMEHYAGNFVAPAAAFIRACKSAKSRTKIADSMKQEASGAAVLTRSLVLRRLLRRGVLEPNEERVGVLIPPTVGGCIVNMALALDRRVAINLNYSLSNELINHCVEDAGIKTILTTRKVAEKFGFEFDCQVVFLDDLREQVTSADKLISAFQAYAMPAGMLIRQLGLHQIKPDDVLTIVFTSGSTGVPKGVMLTQQNIASNVAGIQKVASLRPSDTLIGILPLFHSMGYTVTMWTPLMSPIKGVYHFSPLEAKVIGKLAQKYDGTILVATPTFLRSYMRRCTPEQFAALDMVIAGAERLPAELCDEFEAKFGVRPVEGYGTTETSPVAAVNIPYSRQSGKDFQVESREGTVGRPMPNSAARVTDLDSGEVLGPNESGMLWVKGPNVMLGYLNRPEATEEVLEDGWYKTGDVALIDEDGFIKITGRMSRFSKIGGEMVPHLKIEEVLSRFLEAASGDNDDDGDAPLLVAVTAVPDEKKGERLVVLYTTSEVTPEQMQTALRDEGLPNIFVPTANSFFLVPALPILGTGKLDLRGIKDMALQQCAGGQNGS